MRILRRIFASLRGRIFLAVMLSGLLAGLSAGVASYVVARSMLKDRAEKDVAGVGNDVRRILEGVWIPTLKMEMRVLAEVAAGLYAVNPAPQALRSALAGQQVKVPGFKRINLFHPGGFFLGSTDPAYRGRVEEGISGLQPEEVRIVPFRREGEGTQTEYLMTVAAPIVINGEVIAVLVGDLTPEGISGELGSLTVGISGEVYLVDAEGRLITRPPRARPEMGLEILGEPLDTEGVRRVTEGENGVAEYRNYAGHKVLGGYFHLPETGWGILVEEDVGKAFADLTRLRNLVIYIVAGMALVSMLAAIILARMIARPLRQLREAADKLGLGDLDFRVEIRGSEELQGLVASFNRMADALQSSHLMLEEKVRQRTAELRTLYEMIFSLRGSRDPDEILQKALQAVMDFASCEMGWCYLATGDSFNLLYRRTPAGKTGRLPERFTAGEGPLGEVLAGGEAVFLEVGEIADVSGLARLFPAGSAVLLPLRSAKRTLGLICAASTSALHLGEESRRTLSALADEVGTALENAILYRELQEHVEELERANRELRSLDEMKSNFISTMTHELKQPLSLISGYAQTIRDYYESLTYEEELQCLQVILDRTEFLSRLVDELLDISLLEMGRVRLHREECDLEGLARKVASQQAAKNPDQPLVVDFSPDFPLVKADARRMEQVLTNLVSNAAKFSEGKGEIRIEGRAVGDRVRVRVLDRGIGIEPSQLKRIFNRFYQVDASIKRPYSGVGLGLFICRELVEAHGGRIWAENRPGGGAVVSFEMPREEEKPDSDMENE
ncbi:ATP-binding protein [Candidatus Solincola sp.]|nr:ATP-binding protein [Actinomycetota bacterium]MDI7252886.1 ATP-binding protein [Actinomycetota bacterium]